MPAPHQERVVPHVPPSEQLRQTPNIPSIGDLQNVAAYNLSQHTEARDKAAPGQEWQAATAKIREYGEIEAELRSFESEGVTDAAGADLAINQRIAALQTDSALDSRVRMQEHQKLLRTREFVRATEADQSIFEEPEFTAWKAKKDQAAADRDSRRLQQDRRTADEQQAAKVAEARTEASELHLVQDILQKGGVAVHTALPKAYSANGNAGFGTLTESKRKLPLGRNTYSPFDVDDGRGRLSADKVFGDKGIYEGVVFMPLKETIYEEVENESAKGGLLRRRQKLPAERRATGEKYVQASAAVDGSSDEPAVEMVYVTFGDSSYDGATKYPVPEPGSGASNRGGNVLVVSIIMPKSAAESLKQAGTKDPRIIRKVVEGAVIKNSAIPEKAWHEGDEQTYGKPMKPPYEAWAAKTGGRKMYFQEPGAKQFDENKVVSF